ncbi:MAG: DegV family protein [Coprobacillaceae bacterium]
MSKIVIVAESGSDIEKEVADKYNIYVLPMHVVMDGESLDDGFFPVEKVFAYYDEHKKLPTSSATNPSEYSAVFEVINKKYPGCQILHLCYSAVTTATYQNATIASEDFDNVTHVDTKGVTAGQRAIIIKAAKYIETHPDATISEVVSELEKWIACSYMAFIPSTLDYLLAGGRVSNAAYMGANILKLKPVITIENGYLVSNKRYRGSMMKTCKKLLSDTIEKYQLESESIYLLYSEGLPQEIKQMAESYLEEHGYTNVPWVKTGCVISVHGGPGAFGLGGFILDIQLQNLQIKLKNLP